MKRKPAPPRSQPPFDDATLIGLFERGEALRAEGRVDEARAVWRSIELRNPTAAGAPYMLAQSDLTVRRPADALLRIDAMIKASPPTFNLIFLRARALEGLGRIGEALQAYDEARSMRPGDARLAHAQAAALLSAGRMDAAADAFAALIGTEVGAEAVTGLAMARPARISEQLRTGMQSLADDPAAAADDRVAMNYALGDLFDREGRYDEAFARYSQGAILKRAVLDSTAADESAGEIMTPADAERRRLEIISNMTSIVDAAFIDHYAGQGHPSAAPIFIVGAPRSGSTLIEQILSSHRRVEGLGETPILALATSNKFPFNPIATSGAGHFRAMAEAYLEAAKAQGWSGRGRFVDKMLTNDRAVGVLHLMFPNATIIHAVRDPVDTGLSAYRRLFGAGNETSYDLAQIGRLMQAQRRLMAHWESVLPGRVVTVANEDLVADPEGATRRLLQAADLAWDEKCLRFWETPRGVQTGSMTQVREPIFATSVDRWRRYETHLQPLLTALGPYAPQAVSAGAPALRRVSTATRLKSAGITL